MENETGEEYIVHDICEEFLTKEKYVLFAKYDKYLSEQGRLKILKEEDFYKHFKSKELWQTQEKDK